MSLLQAKQVNKLIDGLIRIEALSVSGTTATVTTAVTTALSSAGQSGVSVPLQVATSSQVGVITTGSNNRVEIYDSTTKYKIDDANENEVYGRLTESSGIYTLSFYVLDAGTETAFTMPSDTIDFEFAYRFDFARVPSDFAIGMSSRNVNQDPSGNGGGSTPVIREVISVTATNTLANLTKTPVGSLELLINGQSLSSVDSPAPFTRAAKVLTWSASNAGYALETTDKVTAVYESNE